MINWVLRVIICLGNDTIINEYYISKNILGKGSHSFVKLAKKEGKPYVKFYLYLGYQNYCLWSFEKENHYKGSKYIQDDKLLDQHANKIKMPLHYRFLISNLCGRKTKSIYCIRIL